MEQVEMIIAPDSPPPPPVSLGLGPPADSLARNNWTSLNLSPPPVRMQRIPREINYCRYVGRNTPAVGNSERQVIHERICSRFSDPSGPTFWLREKRGRMGFALHFGNLRRWMRIISRYTDEITKRQSTRLNERRRDKKSSARTSEMSRDNDKIITELYNEIAKNGDKLIDGCDGRGRRNNFARCASERFSRVSLDYPINSRLRRGNINIMTS